MSETQHRPTESECKKASKRIVRWLQKHASGRPEAEREDLASSAWEHWYTKGKAAPEKYAERVLNDQSRKMRRRDTLASRVFPGVPSSSTEDARVDLLDAALGKVQPEPEPVPRGRGRPTVTRYADRATLAKAARSWAVEKLQRELGIEWSTEFEVHVNTSDVDAVREREAEQIFDGLRAALVQAAQFAAGNADEFGRQRGGTVARWLAWWAPEHIEPLLAQAALQPRTSSSTHEPHTLYENALDRFVRRWDDLDILHLPRRNALDARELALIWMAGRGPLPEVTFPAEGLRPSDACEAQAAAMKAAIKRVGRDYKRGRD